MNEIRLFGLPRRFFIAKHKGRVIAFEGLPRSARRQPSVAWVDNKFKLKKELARAGFPVPKGMFCRREAQAIKAFEELEKPVIVKPHVGSGGRHTTVNINTREDLLLGVANAQVVSPFVIVEEQMNGPVFRATLIGRKLAAVLRRDPPRVFGDGKSTIRELVDEENKNPLRRGPVFADINIDSAYAKKELARQGFAPETVLGAGEVAYFHFKVNWGVGGTSWDVTDETHPENKKLFEDMGEFLGDDIVGIDFIIEDISRSWKEQKRCGVIECNSLPHIGNHHFPFQGKVQNVAGVIWDMAFPESRVLK